MKSAVEIESSNCKIALYRGLKVAVYILDKTELSLTRNDLIELINVCIDFFQFLFFYNDGHA